MAVILTAVVLSGLFYGLGRQLFSSLRGSRRLEMETEDLVKLQKKNLELKSKLAEVGSLRFIETQIRDKLNLSREGETVIIIPQEEIDKVLALEKKEEEVKIPNWQGWLRLLWH